MKRSLLTAAALSLVAFWIADLLSGTVVEAGPHALSNLWGTLVSLPAYVASGHPLATDAISLSIGFAAFCLVWVAWAKWRERAGKYRRGEEHGSSRWATREEMDRFMNKKDSYNNIILTKNCRLRFVDEVHDRRLERNNNVLVIGGSGSGKTRSYVIPNIMQLNADYVVTDPKGTLIGDVGWVLADAGYDVLAFNTIDMAQSMHYNPLAYVYDEQDILSFVNCIVENTTAENEHAGDPFWVNAEKLLYTALVAYLVFHCPKEDQNIPGLLLLLSLADAREEDETYMSPLDLLFHELETGTRLVKVVNSTTDGGFDAESRSFASESAGYTWVKTGDPVEPCQDFALQSYRDFKVAAGKTMKSILISCNVRMKPFGIPQVKELLSRDEMDLAHLGSKHGRSAIIASVSDTDSTYDFLFALLMWQAMDVLCNVAIEEYGGSLPRPVHFMLDEFANIGKIPDFTRKIAVIRSRNISASLILQSIAQLNENYDENGADTIVDCCDTTLFLGGKSEKTKKAISESAGKQTIASVTVNDSRGSHWSTTHNYTSLERDLLQSSEVERMDATEALVLINGAFPFKDKKADLTEHRRYRKGDARGRFDIREYRATRKETG